MGLAEEVRDNPRALYTKVAKAWKEKLKPKGKDRIGIWEQKSIETPQPPIMFGELGAPPTSLSLSLSWMIWLHYLSTQ